MPLRIAVAGLAGELLHQGCSLPDLHLIEVFARVKLEGPRVLVQELVELVSHSHVGNQDVRVDSCAIDGAEEIVFLIERLSLPLLVIRIGFVLFSGAFHDLLLHREELLDGLPIESAAALNSHWVVHDLAAYHAHQVLGYNQRANVCHLLCIVLVGDLLLQQLEVLPILLGNLEKGAQFLQSFHLLLQVI